MVEVSHERSVIQAAAKVALRDVYVATDGYRAAWAEVRHAEQLRDRQLQDLRDKLLLFKQYRLSFEEVVPLLGIVIDPKTVEGWEKLAKGLSYG